MTKTHPKCSDLKTVVRKPIEKKRGKAAQSGGNAALSPSSCAQEHGVGFCLLVLFMLSFLTFSFFLFSLPRR